MHAVAARRDHVHQNQPATPSGAHWRRQRTIPGATVDDIAHRTIETNGLSMHVAEAGEGPFVVLLHGFPES